MTDKHNPFEDDNQFEDDMSDFYEAEEQNGSAANAAPKKKSKLSGKFSGKMPNFINKIPEKYRTRRTAVIVAFVVLVIIFYVFLSGGSNNNSIANSGDIQPAHKSESMMPSIAPAPKQAPKVASVPSHKKTEVKETNELAAFSMPASKPQKPVLPKAPAGVSKAELNAAMTGLVNQIQQMDAGQITLISKKLDNQSANLNAQNSALQSKMADLQKQVAALKGQVSQSNAHVATLQRKVNNLIQGYTGSFNANGEASYHGVPQTAKKVVKAAPTVMNYVVKAVIPGRAWISADNGKTLTVSVGDKIPGYGKVIDINSMNGTVVTDTGTIIKTAG